MCFKTALPLSLSFIFSPKPSLLLIQLYNVGWGHDKSFGSIKIFESCSCCCLLSLSLFITTAHREKYNNDIKSPFLSWSTSLPDHKWTRIKLSNNLIFTPRQCLSTVCTGAFFKQNIILSFFVSVCVLERNHTTWWPRRTVYDRAAARDKKREKKQNKFSRSFVFEICVAPRYRRSAEMALANNMVKDNKFLCTK